MQFDAQIIPWRGSSPTRRTQTNRMSAEPRSKWGFRIRFALGAIIALGWGFLLGVALLRANATLSFWFVGAVIPLAFFGSALACFAFQRALPEWHTLVRLLAALLFAALALPLGLGWALREWELDASLLLAVTGEQLWEIEFGIAILGLIAGTWTGWAHPPQRWLARGIAALLERPTRFFSALFEFVTRVIASIGRAILWLPLKIIALVRGLINGIASFFSAMRIGIVRLIPRRNRVRLPKPSLFHRHAAPQANGSARIKAVVEERCPYCLDVVKRNDPRGIKVCEVCHTPHHADCWAITGKCQVPHLNT
ncbi:MAG: hypothetical protein HY868_10890 [Chloroflexi bacterium]|nr:hypothetical protein [Chloroflexota bacterium]